MRHHMSFPLKEGLSINLGDDHLNGNVKKQWDYKDLWILDNHPFQFFVRQFDQLESNLQAHFLHPYSILSPGDDQI